MRRGGNAAGGGGWNLFCAARPGEFRDVVKWRGWIIAGLALLPLAGQAADVASKITVENFDATRLGAAIFAESNRVRRQHGRARLRDRAELRAAADGQASAMAFQLRAVHTGPFTGQHSAWQRVEREGLEPEVVTENVSMISVPTAASGESWGDDYGRLAAEIVRAWLDSPGHRQNLLSGEVTTMGCAARLARVPAGPNRVFSAQVFCRPLSRSQAWVRE